MPAKPRPLLDFRDVPAALGLLTRLPVKVNTHHAIARGAAAAWAYPLVGLVVSGVALMLGFGALGIGLSPAGAAGLILATQVVLTGAMHEDGLADCTDGFWGGWTRKRRLEIMKDSRIGAYGVLGLIFAIGLKWVAITEVLSTASASLAMAWVLSAAVLSRSSMVCLMAVLPHARPSGLAAAVGRPSRGTALIALGLGTGLAGLMLGFAALGLAVLTIGVVASLAKLARRRIGGQTGDVLGGAQMVTETLLLLAASATTSFQSA